MDRRCKMASAHLREPGDGLIVIEMSPRVSRARRWRRASYMVSIAIKKPAANSAGGHCASMMMNDIAGGRSSAALR